MTAETAQQAVELLFLPAVRLVHLCLPHLERSAGGRIVAITSIAAKEPVRQPRALERLPAGGHAAG